MPTLLLTLCMLLTGLVAIHAHPSLAAESNPLTFHFGAVAYGLITPYHQQPKLRHDLSGAAYHDGLIITVDDGGKPSDYPYLHALDRHLEQPPRAITISATLKDLEGATWSRGYYVITTSMALLAQPALTQPAFSGISRFTVNRTTWQLMEFSQTPLRTKVLNGLQQHFANPAWFERVAVELPRKGGLNIEAISRSADEQGAEKLLLGLRSPLYGHQFGNPTHHSSLSLFRGDAIVATISNPFTANPSLTFATLNLNGQGIRAMEWIPTLNGYIIISGAITRGRSFNLWFWPGPKGAAQPLSLPGFQQLCRPESVIPWQENQQSYLVVLSERSGLECANTDFSFIKASIDHAEK